MRFNKDYYVLSAYSFWLLVNVPAWAGEKSAALLAMEWGSIDLLTRYEGPIFPITYSLSVASFAVAVFVLKKHLPLKKCLLYGATFPFAPVGAFELFYQNAGDVLRPHSFHTDAHGELVLLSWVVLGFSTFVYWKPSRIFYILLLSNFILFVAWGLSGYLQYYEANMSGLVFNILLKVDFFAVFWSLLLEFRAHSVRFRMDQHDFSPRKLDFSHTKGPASL